MDAAAARRAPLHTRIPYLHLGLFLATVVTTVTFGGTLAGSAEPDSWTTIAPGGLPFAAALISILLCHEMGHYLMARAYGVDATLPFFIPVPFGVGTFGAIIRIRSDMPSRRAVFDIGSAGPFAGFAVALPLYAWGIAHSRVHVTGDLAFTPSDIGSPFRLAAGLWRGLSSGLSLGESWAALATGGWAQFFGDSALTWGVARAVLGPLPENAAVLVHPVAFAAWIGLFITTLNLIPIGQLDGGHVTYALLGGRRALAFSRLVAWGLLACGIFLSWTWVVWWAVTRWFIGPRHPPPLEDEPLDPRRRALAIAALVLFALTFVPIPTTF